MKRTRRIAFLLVTVLVMSLMSISAFAKSKYQVPTAGEYYTWNTYKNQWDKVGTFTAAYKSDGSITNYKYTDYQDPAYTWSKPANTREIKYTWKKGFLTKQTRINTSYFTGENNVVYPDTYTYTTKFKYKGGLPKKVSSTSQHLDTDPNYADQNNTISSVTNYSWKGKIGTAKVSTKNNGRKDSYLVEATKKKQLKGSYNGNSKAEYAKNGNIKKETTKYSGSQYKGTYTKKYNKYGYVSSISLNETYTMPDKVGTVSGSTVVSYVMGAGKCPSEILYTVTSYNGTYRPKYPPKTPITPSVSQYRVVITATKGVKSIKNCDKYGNDVLLGINLESSLTSDTNGANSYVNYDDDDD